MTLQAKANTHANRMMEMDQAILRYEQLSSREHTRPPYKSTKKHTEETNNVGAGATPIPFTSIALFMQEAYHR